MIKLPAHSKSSQPASPPAPTEETLATRFKALAHPARVRLACQLAAHPEMRFKDLAAAMDQTPPTTSQHLEHMIGAGLVCRTGSGKAVRYRFSPEPLGSMAWLLKALAETHAAR